MGREHGAVLERIEHRQQLGKEPGRYNAGAPQLVSVPRVGGRAAAGTPR